MNQKIHLSDINILIHLFIQKDVEINYIGLNNEQEIISSNSNQDTPKVLFNFNKSVDLFSKFPIKQFDFIFDFGSLDYNPFGLKKKKFYFIHNPDKTMRWIFPSNLEKPTFLNFYNSATIKAKIFSEGLKIGFKSPLAFLLRSGSFKLYHKNELALNQLTTDFNCNNYSVFTGTVGPNRKLIIELNKNGETLHYIKRGLNQKSKELIKKETKNLLALNSLKLNHLIVPKIHSNNDGIVAFSNIKPKKEAKCDTISDAHLYALRDLYMQSATHNTIDNSLFTYKIKKNLDLLENLNRTDLLKDLFLDLKRVLKDLNQEEIITYGRNHADFTPWNCYVNNNKIYAYDWELSTSKAPLLFDLFHFIFQSEVLLKQKNYQAIKEQLNIALSKPLAKELIAYYKINVELHLKLYLLSNISYYLHIYDKQKELHKQAYWLIDIWKEALQDIAPLPKVESFRNQFIKEFTSRLDNTRYAMLKFNEQRIENIKESSDLDILILKEDLPAMNHFASSHKLVSKVKINKKSFMTSIELFFKDNTFLSLDLIHQFQRKWVSMLDTKKMLISTNKNEYGVSVSDVRFDFEYLFLFHHLNGASIPKKYQLHFKKLSTIDQLNIQKFITSSYNLENTSIDKLFVFNKERTKKIKAVLSARKENSGVSLLKNVFNYLKDCIIEIKSKKGFVITFSGVDGAGKSSIIENITRHISIQFRRKVVVLRHRPSLLPILSTYKYGKKEAQNRAANTLPRKGNNTALISSLIRFSYYFTDYLFGQFYIYFKYVLRGYVVVYDRYYFDFINDAKRSNIVLPKNFVKVLYNFVIKPRLNIFLYADAKTILARKQELDKETIERLTSDYKLLFQNYNSRYENSKYVQVENLEFQKTINTIIKEFSQAA